MVLVLHFDLRDTALGGHHLRFVTAEARLYQVSREVRVEARASNLQLFRVVDLQGAIRHAGRDPHLVLRYRDAPASISNRSGCNGLERKLHRFLGDSHLELLRQWYRLAAHDRQLREPVLREATELVAPKDLPTLRRDTFEVERVRIQAYRRVEAHPRKLQRHEGALPALFELRERTFGGDFLQVLVQVLDSLELLKEFRGALRSYASHAGDVVRGIAGEGFVVGDLLRRHTVLVDDFLASVLFCL